MKALGRVERQEVFSLLGSLYDEIGPDDFMKRLARTCRAAFLDTRVLFAHWKKKVTPADRFLSDLDRWEKIADPEVRELTRAAASAPIPIVLGGHSLISGGLFALVDSFWRSGDVSPELLR